MILLYIWAGLAGLLCVLFVLKLLLQIGMAGSGRRADWSSYNAMLLGLLIVVLFPITVLAACLKKVR